MRLPFSYTALQMLLSVSVKSGWNRTTGTLPALPPRRRAALAERLKHVQNRAEGERGRGGRSHTPLFSGINAAAEVTGGQLLLNYSARNCFWQERQEPNCVRSDCPAPVKRKKKATTYTPYIQINGYCLVGILRPGRSAAGPPVDSHSDPCQMGHCGWKV